jgi:hypothetical protein
VGWEEELVVGEPEELPDTEGVKVSVAVLEGEPEAEAVIALAEAVGEAVPPAEALAPQLPPEGTGAADHPPSGHFFNASDAFGAEATWLALRDAEPMAWDFVMNFARDNKLQVVDAAALPPSPTEI